MSSRSRLAASSTVLVVALLELAACGGKGKAGAPTLGNNGGGGGGGGVPYAGVFVERPAATYRYESKTSMYDPDDPKADANGQVVDTSTATLTCATKLATVDAWQVAMITCTGADEAGIAELLATRFAAGPAGIWRLTADDTADVAGLANLAARPPLLVAAPAPVDDKHEEEDGAFGEFRKVYAEGAGWCVETGGWGGDEAGDGICFDPARGITKVTRYFAGGSVHDESLELVR